MEDNSIKTGTEAPDNSDTIAEDVDADVVAFADDGEFATTWAVERVDDETVAVETHRWEAGLGEVDGEVEYRSINDARTTRSFARQIADHRYEDAVEAARTFWEGR